MRKDIIIFIIACIMGGLLLLGNSSCSLIADADSTFHMYHLNYLENKKGEKQHD